jgi:hypothetical protein
MYGGVKLIGDSRKVIKTVVYYEEIESLMKYTDITFLPKDVVALTHSPCFLGLSYLKSQREVPSDLDIEIILVWQPMPHMQ